MPSNEQRRQAAKRKLERQLARRVERAKRRRRRVALGSGIAVVVVLLVVFGIVYLAGNHGTSNAAGQPTTTPTPPAKTTGGPCKYTSTPTQPAPKGKDEGMPTDPNPTPNTGTETVTLQTTQGAIPLTLDKAEAPCTVQSFAFLAQKTFFNNTPCHRLTSDPMLKVLQCGDPTGTGQGGPGYTIPDEKPKSLKLAPTTTPVPQGQEAYSIYPAGTVAMANTGQPHTGGSQFFLVYGDSQLPADYTVFGTVSSAGMTTLAKIAAGGIIPGTDPQSGQPTPTDGKPKLPVTVSQATVAG